MGSRKGCGRSDVYAMTHYVKDGQQTPLPENLSAMQKLRTLFFGVRIPRPVNHKTPKDLGLSFARHTFVSQSRMKLEGWYIPVAKGLKEEGIVLLFHGYANRKASLLEEARLFHQMGYSAFLVDFRGSGGSDGWITSLGYFEADDVISTIRYTHKQGWAKQKRLLLFGFSMGAVAVLRAVAEKNARADGLLLSCAFDRLLDTIKNRFATMGVPAFPSAHMMMFWGSLLHGFNSFSHNPETYARKVAMPSLILQGDKDLRVSIPQARRLYRGLAGPKFFQLFAGFGHVSFAQKAPILWKKAVKDILDTLQAKRPQRSAVPLQR